MPTIEERLAALETKLAALTETTPTNYYEHQYSGEEIDAAVGRALTGGALDTSVTNVSNQLGTFVRPNLLDNWYFGRPVDQRKGYIQIGGTMMYKDPACTDQFGPSNGTTPVVVYATYARPIDHGVELGLYIPLNNIVRGYTRNGYTVDRWFFDTDSGSCSLTLTNDGLKFIATASATGIASLKQDIDPTMLSVFAGKTVTLSILGKTDISQQVLFYVNSKIAAVNSSPAVNGVCMTTLTYTFPDVLTGAAIFVYGRTYAGAGDGTIIAAKLELGPTQTLAHREGDRWVMNEVPNYGEQLRRCQRYQFEVFDRTSAGQGYLAQVKAIDGTQAYGVLPTPVTMRDGVSPALVTDCSAANPYGAFGIYSTGYSGGMGVITGLSLFSKVQNGVILRAVGSNFVAGNDYQIWVDNQKTHQVLLNANL